MTVEHIYPSGTAPTLERVRGALRRLFVPGAPPDPARAADLTPVAEQLLAAAAAAGLALRAAPRALLLKEAGGPRAVPIVIGVPEAEAVALELQGHAAPRPLTYDLLRRALEAGGLRVQQAAVTRLEARTYFAEVTLQGPAGQPVALDARPSDAVNLALRTGAPLYVAAELLLSPEAAQRFLEDFGARFEGFGTWRGAPPPA